MSGKKILSYAASFVLFAATGLMIILVLQLDTSGAGITNGEFIPIRNCMLAVGVPCLIKFYVSCDREYKESRYWMIGYFICVALWIAFLAFAYTSHYFTNIRTMCLASFVLMCLAVYLQYSMTEK